MIKHLIPTITNFKEIYIKSHTPYDQRSLDILLRELYQLTDIHHAALSELANQMWKNINLSHIERIAEALYIDNIREIIELVDSEE